MNCHPHFQHLFFDLFENRITDLHIILVSVCEFPDFRSSEERTLLVGVDKITFIDLMFMGPCIIFIVE